MSAHVYKQPPQAHWARPFARMHPERLDADFMIIGWGWEASGRLPVAPDYLFNSAQRSQTAGWANVTHLLAGGARRVIFRPFSSAEHNSRLWASMWTFGSVCNKAKLFMRGAHWMDGRLSLRALNGKALERFSYFMHGNENKERNVPARLDWFPPSNQNQFQFVPGEE